jgi:hypothetical protein
MEFQVRNMTKFVSTAALALVTLLIAACGGDAFTGTSSGPSGVSTATAIVITTGSPTVSSDGSGSAVITAVAKDGNNNAVSGAVVTFSASAGSLVVTQGTTDSTGTATATLTAAGVAVNTVITVTANTGTASGNVTITVANTQQTISLETDSPQIPSDGSKPATITALVRDASNNFVPGVIVHFTSTSGGLTIESPTGTTLAPGTTDASGAATATLSTAGVPDNRTITVTATLGNTNATIAVNVVGTTLTLSGPSSLVQGSQGTYSIALADAGKNAISGAAVTVASSAGNTLSSSTITTDSSGHGTFQLTATKSGTDTISVGALGLSAAQSVAVSNQLFTFTAPAANAQIALGQTATVTVNWTSSGQPVVNQVVTFSSTRGTLSAQTATTDASGNASVTVVATSAGPAIISATATGVTATQNVSFVATTANSIAVQASPSTITIKGQSTITAIVRDPQNNLVQGKTVAFQLSDVTGGQLSFATAMTDEEGVAQTVYTASSTPSTSNGVVVTATVQGTSISQFATLTVGGQTVFISLGTGAKINENSNFTQFQMPWVVQAVDSAGNPVNNVAILLTIHSASRPYNAYFKGAYQVCGSAWVQYNGTPGCTGNLATTPIVGCANEDLNLTGVFDPAEDTNTNGKLDPGDVAVATPGSVTTGADGSATFLVEYPEDHALWVQATLTATATVQGTQSSTTSTFVLPILASYLTSIQSSPPGAVSPYGIAGVCTDKR